MLYRHLLPLALCLAGSASAACGQRCVIASSGNSTSDAAAIADAFVKCASDAEIVFSEGVEYKAFEPVVATKLSNVVITVAGNLSLPQDIPAMQKLVELKGGSLTWFQIGGTNVKWIGSAEPDAGWIKSYGQAWWDLNKPGEAGTPNRPHLMQFSVTNGVMRNMKSLKPIGWNFSIKGKNITIANTVIDARSESSSFPFNTDGFDVGATDVTITNSNIFNGDDAIAINDGAKNVLFRDATIGFETHGMSVGSLGSKPASPADVQNIRFEDVTVRGGLYAARFKSWIGGQGLAKNITWSNIRVDNVTFPIFVTQTYYNQASVSGERPNNSSVMMEDFTWEHFSGNINTYNPGDGSCTTNPCWYNAGLGNLTHSEAIIIECNTEKSCKNFRTKDIKVEPQSKTVPKVICMNAMPDLNPKLGFECANGTFVPSG
ncbi:Glycosyl hydrolase family 28 [Colletotrichum higginsianum IMI 349063]|uniref:galacturonan 1,4-alpha-galacturonidase n=1 Tax=Colletotrichum higginsianum (strain IMI 349063) TaxID=759273 RepID=A0A1B7YW00_COLHI|nr:Glycosyl hydrolase family 28 [Colletotrichum higginsianum IMI 349063]OBR16124.1 Glycosyl hydrolase family 28 [Colletotrichum higginsianum IMI 349063]